MSERLAAGRLDRLAEDIWHLGQISMQHLFEIAPVPSVVKGELYHDDLCLEPEFLLNATYPDVLNELPRKVGLSVSEIEPYARDDDFTIYTYQRVDLNTRRHTRQYSEGVIMMDSNGNTLSPALNMPSIGRSRRLGSVAWREIKTQLKVKNFGLTELEYFTAAVERVTQQIHHDMLDEGE